MKWPGTNGTVRRGSWRLAWSLPNVPLPSAGIYTHKSAPVLPEPDPDGRTVGRWQTTELILSAEFGVDGIDPVVSVEVALPWQRPRPFEADVRFPPTTARGWRRLRENFVWREA